MTENEVEYIRMGNQTSPDRIAREDINRLCDEVLRLRAALKFIASLGTYFHAGVCKAEMHARAALEGKEHV